MRIRKAAPEDTDRIMEIYEYARAFMAQHGNPNQWGQMGWPWRCEIEEDTKAGNGYVCVIGPEGEDAGKPGKTDIIGAFSLTCGVGIEKDYETICGPGWRKDGAYGVIHRIASDGTQKGVAQFCFSWAAEQIPYLRLDTHEDNIVMQNAAERFGFRYCGTVQHEDAPGEWPAYDYLKE